MLALREARGHAAIGAPAAPPKVRAAAFQAIAAYPNVTNLGPVEYGVPLPAGARWGDLEGLHPCTGV
jgi:hypothetical protein